MPWKISSLLGERRRFIQAVLRKCKSMAQVCRDFGISGKTGCKWWRRFQQHGRSGLGDRSRRPHRSPCRMAGRWQRAIRRWRQAHPSWGAKKIHAQLRRAHRRAALPKVRTLTRWWHRLGLVRRPKLRTRRGPTLARPALTVPQAPNQVWTVDFKGWFRTLDGTRVDPLTVRDLFSRYLLGIDLQHPQRDQPVRRHMHRLFQRYGRPEVIRVDHGAPFAGVGALALSRLSVWWLRLGIRVEFTGRARPQDNAAHEQMHRIYKAEVASPPAATRRGQQARTTRWRQEYNQRRPHEALGQQTPATFYRKSRHRYRARLAALQYPRSWSAQRVTPSGRIRWRGRQRVIGRAFGGERIGLKPIQTGVHEVYLGRQRVGLLFDTDAGGMRPARWSKPAFSASQP